MANYYKSFSFKNGIQVDNDNFVVNTNGLVGIGTTVPTEVLDVRGNVKVVGIISATDIVTNNFRVSGVSTLTSLNVGNINLTSGIVTASSGIITYYGDGSKLSNIPASYWVGSSNKFYTNANIGIGTTNPEFNLQIGTNPLLTASGLSLDSSGNIYSNGNIVAGEFTGDGSGITEINASNIASGTLSTSRFPQNITLSGIITASFSGSGVGLTSINASNISSGTLNNSRLPSNISVSGIVTASTFVGNLTGTASTASSLTTTGSISLGSVNAGFASIGIATISNVLQVVGFPAKIGVGTTSEPNSDIEVRKTGISSIRVISENNIALIGIGRSSEIRTGNTDTFYSYSTPNSLDIINLNSGNVNFYLDYGTPGLSTGNFNWIYGQVPFNPLMTLTYDGKLGLGVTNPSSKLQVIGSSYFSGITTVNSDLNVSNDLYVNGDIIVDGSIKGIVEAQNTAYVSSNILSLDATQGSVFTHTVSEKIGIVSFTGISTNRAGIQRFTVLLTQGNVALNTSPSSGIGTQLATIVTESGVGFNTHIKVGGGTTITLTNSPGALDILTFLVSYNGNTPITNSSFTVIGAVDKDFRGAI